MSVCWKNIFLRSTLFSSLSFLFPLTFAGSPLTLFLLVRKATLFCFFCCAVLSLVFFFGRGGSSLFSCPLSPPLPPFAPSLPLSLLYPSLRMKLWGRSAWPLQVAFLVALVMLCVDPVSAGSRNHRGPTGTPGLAPNPPPTPREVNYTVTAEVKHMFPEPVAD